MNPFITRVTQLTVAPEGEPIFSETATIIEIDDEAAGEFIVIKQTFDHAKLGEVSFDLHNWPAVRDAVETLLKNTLP